MLVGALIHAGEVCERGNLFSVFLVTTHRSVREPERERGIGIAGRPFRGETRLRNFGIGLLLNFFLRLENLLRLARGCINGTRNVDHRVVRRFDRSLTAAVKFFPERDILELRSFDQF